VGDDTEERSLIMPAHKIHIAVPFKKDTGCGRTISPYKNLSDVLSTEWSKVTCLFCLKIKKKLTTLRGL
jgi:hypothetical protein